MTVEIRGANGAPIAETTTDAVPPEGAGVTYFGEPCTAKEVTWKYDGSWSAIVMLDKPASELEVRSWKPRLRD